MVNFTFPVSDHFLVQSFLVILVNVKVVYRLFQL